MKKGLFIVVLIALMLGVFAIYQTANAATDSTKAISEYVAQGRHADYLVNDVMDHNGPAATRIQTRMISSPLPDCHQAATTAGDTTYTAVMIVPTGMEFIVDSLWYGTRIEGNIGGTKHLTLTLLKYDASAAVTDTLVFRTTLDADSAAFDNARTLLTLHTGGATYSATTTKVFNAGDILWAQVSWDSTLTTLGKGQFISVKGRQIY
jgi:hypothetical protein